MTDHSTSYSGGTIMSVCRVQKTNLLTYLLNLLIFSCRMVLRSWARRRRRHRATTTRGERKLVQRSRDVRSLSWNDSLNRRSICRRLNVLRWPVYLTSPKHRYVEPTGTWLLMHCAASTKQHKHKNTEIHKKYDTMATFKVKVNCKIHFGKS